MRRILIHAGMSPLDRPNLDRVFAERLFTSNSGNLMFQYTAYRTLMTEDAEIVTRFLDRDDFTPAQIDEINSRCDCVVLPMANNFRKDYIPKLRQMTTFLRRLRVPCAVMGIGLQAGAPSQIAEGFPFDEDVKAFVSAALDRSAMLGLRGGITADYLKRLGFAPERHFTVIGCPSMFAAGPRLPETRLLPLDRESPIAINYRKEQPGQLFDLMQRAAAELPNYSLLFQRVEEMFMLRYGWPLHYESRSGKANAGRYIRSRRDPLVRSGQAFGFASAAAWRRFMAGMRFSCGCRIHGNIVAVQAGTPALVFTIDTRTEELCRYHRIPFVPAAQITPETSLRDLYERTDFTTVHDGHEARFRHFLDFLNANGLDHIYSCGPTPARVPLEEALAKLPEWGLIANPDHISPLRRLKGAEIMAARKVRWKLDQRRQRTAGR